MLKRRMADGEAYTVYMKQAKTKTVEKCYDNSTLNDQRVVQYMKTHTHTKRQQQTAHIFHRVRSNRNNVVWIVLIE